MKKKKSRAPLPLPSDIAVETGRETEDGVSLLFWRVEFPALNAAFARTDAASFYAELARRATGCLSGQIADLLRAQYRASDPARRRFTFRPAVYAHTVRFSRENDALAVERTVAFSRAGRVLFSRVFCERWDPFDGSFLPSPDDGRQNGSNSPAKTAKKAVKKVDGGAGNML
ncbi:MAG: hypothetical protein J5958_06380 [Clostridia bacterium]|nr:hypothetical protein [Clostridia bacterium]